MAHNVNQRAPDGFNWAHETWRCLETISEEVARQSPEELAMGKKPWDVFWRQLQHTGRCNESVRMMCIPIQGSERFLKFVYRGVSKKRVRKVHAMAEADMMRRFEAIKRAGYHLHTHVPKLYWVKHTTDRLRGSTDKEGLVIEAVQGAENADKCWKNRSVKRKLGGDTFDDDDEGWTVDELPPPFTRWSFRDRRAYLRRLALFRLQMVNITRDVISGGCGHPMYDQIGGYEHGATFFQSGDESLAASKSDYRLSKYHQRGRMLQIENRDFKLGHYSDEKDSVMAFLDREIAFWSSLDGNHWEALRAYFKDRAASTPGGPVGAVPLYGGRELFGQIWCYEDSVDWWCCAERIVPYLQQLQRYIKQGGHRFRLNSHQLFKGHFPLGHWDAFEGNNMMLLGKRLAVVIDWELGHFTPVSVHMHDVFQGGGSNDFDPAKEKWFGNDSRENIQSFYATMKQFWFSLPPERRQNRVGQFLDGGPDRDELERRRSQFWDFLQRMSPHKDHWPFSGDITDEEYTYFFVALHLRTYKYFRSIHTGEGHENNAVASATYQDILGPRFTTEDMLYGDSCDQYEYRTRVSNEVDDDPYDDHHSEVLRGYHNAPISVNGNLNPALAEDFARAEAGLDILPHTSDKRLGHPRPPGYLQYISAAIYDHLLHVDHQPGHALAEDPLTVYAKGNYDVNDFRAVWYTEDDDKSARPFGYHGPSFPYNFESPKADRSYDGAYPDDHWDGAERVPLAEEWSGAAAPPGRRYPGDSWALLPKSQEVAPEDVPQQALRKDIPYQFLGLRIKRGFQAWKRLSTRERSLV